MLNFIVNLVAFYDTIITMFTFSPFIVTCIWKLRVSEIISLLSKTMD